jgi:hypothetical protein
MGHGILLSGGPRAAAWALLLAGSVAAAGPPEEVVVKLTGPDGKPLIGALAFNLTGVWVATELPATTDEFRVARPAKGKTRMAWFVHEAKQLAGSVAVSNDSTGPLAVRMQPWGTVTGRITDEKGKPWEGVTVYARGGPKLAIDLEARASHDRPIGQDGRFRIDRLIPGMTYNLMIVDRSISFAYWGPEFVVKPGETKDLAELVIKHVTLPKGVGIPPQGAAAETAPRLVTRLDDSKAAQEYQADFREMKYDMRGLRIDAPAGLARLVKPEKKGLRFTIPAGLGQGPSVVTKFGVRGDFEITATFEALSRERPNVGWGMGPELFVKPPGGWDKFASMGRFLQVKDAVFSFVHGSKVGEEKKYDAFSAPTTVTSGRFRMVRIGPTLHFQYAEGDAKEFREVFQTEYGTQDLEFVRLSAATGGSQKAVDAIWKDLSVRAEELTGYIGGRPKPKGSPWRVAAVAVPVALLVGLMGLAWWRGASRRKGGTTGSEDVGPVKGTEWDEAALASMEASAAEFAKAHPDVANCAQRPKFQFSTRDGLLHGPFVAWRTVAKEDYDRLGGSWDEVREKLPRLFEGSYLEGQRHGTFSCYDAEGRATVRRYQRGEEVR